MVQAFKTASVRPLRPCRQSPSCRKFVQLSRCVLPRLVTGHRRSVSCSSSLDVVAAIALFLTPGALALCYAVYRGQGNLQDGISHLLTEVSQGYLQPDAGGKNMPSAEGDLSEFTGSYIGFLYKMCDIGQDHTFEIVCMYGRPKMTVPWHLSQFSLCALPCVHVHNCVSWISYTKEFL
jgi:hypothetical protein